MCQLVSLERLSMQAIKIVVFDRSCYFLLNYTTGLDMFSLKL